MHFKMIKVPKGKLVDVGQQVTLMKLQLEQLRQMQMLSMERHFDFANNCRTILSIVRERQKETVLEQLIAIDSVVQSIQTDALCLTAITY